MTNREKMMTVFREALDSVLPGNLIRETLRHEAGILTIGGKSYRLGEYRGVHFSGAERPRSRRRGPSRRFWETG